MRTKRSTTTDTLFLYTPSSVLRGGGRRAASGRARRGARRQPAGGRRAAGGTRQRRGRGLYRGQETADLHPQWTGRLEGVDREGGCDFGRGVAAGPRRSEEHTSELQSLMRISYAVFCLKKKKRDTINKSIQQTHYHPQTTASNH